MEPIYYKCKDGVHFYKDIAIGKILHVVCNTDKHIDYEDVLDGGKLIISGEIPKGTYLINNLTELPDKELLVATKEQFTVAINRAIFELGIYEQTISKK